MVNVKNIYIYIIKGNILKKAELTGDPVAGGGRDLRGDSSKSKFFALLLILLNL